jgi:membrane-associated protease RseP (regulator of RpoE activity)
MATLRGTIAVPCEFAHAARILLEAYSRVPRTASPVLCLYGRMLVDSAAHRTPLVFFDPRSFLADSAETSVAFTLADATKVINIDLAKGEGTGVTLVTNTAGVGVVVTALVAGCAAARSGMEVGHVIVSMDGILASDHRQVVRQMDDGTARLAVVVAARKLTQANVLTQHVGQVPCEIVIESSSGANGLMRRLSRH